jgi:hypothetical protein
MFKLDNGGFLGGDILRSLYERQNEKIRKLINDDNEFRKYEIKNAPTLKDLSGALKNLKPESLNALNDVSVENNSKIIQYKRSIESYQSDIRSFVNDKFNTTIVDDNILYTLKDGNFSLSKREPSVLFDKLVTLNGFVNDTGNIPINNGTNKFKDNVKSAISKSNNEDLKQYGKK